MPKSIRLLGQPRKCMQYKILGTSTEIIKRTHCCISNSGYANMPQCHVICMLPLVYFMFLSYLTKPYRRSEIFQMKTVRQMWKKMTGFAKIWFLPQTFPVSVCSLLAVSTIFHYTKLCYSMNFFIWQHTLLPNNKE